MESDPYIGRTIGSFRILSKLGEGGMGAVYKAVHGRLDRVVAFKILPQRLVHDNPQFKERFFREARAAAHVSHPNIVQVHDAEEVEGLCYIAMEFVRGVDVKALMKKKSPLAEAEAVDLALQAARGLDAASEHNIIHRDIKPANLMVTPKGTLKVADFGLAKNVEAVTELTQSGQIMGTPAYMSPEQADAQAVDLRSDVYSMGVCLFEMATGSRPYVADTPIGLIKKHCLDPVPDPGEKRPGLHAGLCGIIRKMMEKKPQDRFQSWGELARELEKVGVELGGIDKPGEEESGPTRSLKGGAASAIHAIVEESLVSADAAAGEVPGASKPPAPDATPTPGTRKASGLHKAMQEGVTLKPFHIALLSAGGILVLAAVAAALFFGGVFDRYGGTGAKNHSNQAGSADDVGSGEGRSSKPSKGGGSHPLESHDQFNIVWTSPKHREMIREERVPVFWTVEGRAQVGTAGKLGKWALDESDFTTGKHEKVIQLAEGEHNLKFEVWDSENVLFTRTIRLTIDSTPPEIILDSVEGKRSTTREAKFRLSGKVEDLHPGTLRVDGDAVSMNAGRFSTLIELKEGANLVTMSSTDAAGNRAEMRLEIHRDLTPPVIEIENFKENVFHSDPRHVIDLLLSEECATITVEGCGSTLLDHGSKTARFELELEEGANAIKIKALDSAGNRSKKKAFIHFTRLPPGLHSTGPDGLFMNSRDRHPMVMIPAGTYACLPAEENSGKTADGTVEVSTYFIGRHEVTNNQFTVFLNDVNRTRTEEEEPYFFFEKWEEPGFENRGGSWRAAPGAGKLPAVNVTWFGAKAYAEWAGGALPTETQWEVAAACVPGGGGPRTYPWGSAKPTRETCNFGKVLGRLLDSGQPDGDKSAFGVFGMAGNAMEWCLNDFEKDWRPGGKVRRSERGMKSVRGGSFWHPAERCRCRARFGLDASRGLSTVGFRYVIANAD